VEQLNDGGIRISYRTYLSYLTGPIPRSGLPDLLVAGLIKILGLGHQQLEATQKEAPTRPRLIKRREVLKMTGAAASTVLVGGSHPNKLTTSPSDQVAPARHVYVVRPPIYGDDFNRRLDPLGIALQLHQAGDWDLASRYWLRERDVQAINSDQRAEAFCMIEASTMLMMAGKVRESEELIKQCINVIKFSETAIGIDLLTKATLFLSTLLYNQDRFSDAIKVLSDVLRYLASSQNMSEGDLKNVVDDKRKLHYIREDIQFTVLLGSYFHYLGGSLGLRGFYSGNKESSEMDFAESYENIERAKKVYDVLKDELGVSQELLALSLPIARVSWLPTDNGSFEYILDESREKIGNFRFIEGSINMTLARIGIRPNEHLEEALDVFTRSSFQPLGVSRALRDLSRREMESNPNRSLRLALISAALHPYGMNLENILMIANPIAQEMGTRKFWNEWSYLEQSLLAMNSDDFVILRGLVRTRGSYEETVRFLTETAHMVKSSISGRLPNYLGIVKR